MRGSRTSKASEGSSLAATARSTRPAQSAAPAPLSSACACGGACPRCAAPVAGAGLRLTAPGDAHEREAEHIANAALERIGPVGRDGAPAEITGDRLPPGLRHQFERGFAADFRAVRIYADGAAARNAKALQARAYTFGNEIWFGAGQYAPGAAAGRRLIAHELGHVVQQQRGRLAPGAVVARDFYSTAEAEAQAEEEMKQKKWSRAYGRDPSQAYGAERGSIDEDVTYTGKDGRQHTRHQPALDAASQASGPNGQKGSPMDMTKAISDDDVVAVMTDPNYGDRDRAEIQDSAKGAGDRMTQAFRIMQIDTLEAQALYMAHAAVESRGLRSMTAQADPAVVGQFAGRGPLQVTFQQNYIKTLAYLDEQAKRLDAQGKADEAAQARAASDAIKADPAKAADPQYAFIFSAAMMHAAGGVRASAEMAGRSADFGGTGPEDRWETGGDNFDERIAYWTAQKAAGNAAADERLAYWTGVKRAGQRKTKAYNRALDVLKKNLRQSAPTPMP